MAEIFNNVPGMVTVLDTTDSGSNPFRLTMDGFPQTGAQSGVIVTELGIQRHGNFQFLHTLQDLVYVYSFGERIGQMRISGIAFSQMCNGVQGLSTVLAYYEANRLENRSSPISIAIGTSDAGRFRGFLTELNAEVSRPEANLAQFGMQFHSLPSSSGTGVSLGTGYYTPAPRTILQPTPSSTLGGAPASGGMDSSPAGGMGSMGGMT